jgi:hypothetical protein
MVPDGRQGYRWLTCTFASTPRRAVVRSGTVRLYERDGALKITKLRLKLADTSRK